MRCCPRASACSVVVAAMLALQSVSDPQPQSELLGTPFTPPYLARDGGNPIWLAKMGTVESTRFLSLVIRLHDSKNAGYFIEAVGKRLEKLDPELEGLRRPDVSGGESHGRF
ncbi:uncharacterized protein PHACADRAFT_186350 [Phanerochaete carnosa HHB-10118-sp]|uniref:Uncharacterized protein n=1 Tax=Phanerochaete carnosa (strain HHB-10118-sp) TaxID=650164 RepID=K5VQP1_PHACS|nr:uncharacterized protein PHACADRAFT_186350 [Phanerochaete carnosa HHB-10118-sp]EKM53783.1 hypothetical protein PHACADRAFT_186350 [Phanerochaete carnosa HHB-10118-sp]